VYIAIYARISTVKQDNFNQLGQLRDFAATQGWNISKEYVDVATGKNGDREQFKALFSAASRREFELVLFWSLDRFSREGVFETLQYLQRLTAYGVGYRSFTEQYLDSCGMFKDAVISILAIIAKQERVRLSERTLAGLARARAQGRVGGRPRIQCDFEQVLKLRAAGHSFGKIAKQVGLTKTMVCRVVAAATAPVQEPATKRKAHPCPSSREPRYGERLQHRKPQVPASGYLLRQWHPVRARGRH
jgi:DNA invertase Pin-like site-specific DNA recombinase